MTVLELANKFKIDTKTRIKVDVVNDYDLFLYASMKSFYEEYTEKYGSLTVIDFNYDGHLNVYAMK